jgi:hypothetical protein
MKDSRFVLCGAAIEKAPYRQDGIRANRMRRYSKKTGIEASSPATEHISQSELLNRIAAATEAPSQQSRYSRAARRAARFTGCS